MVGVNPKAVIDPLWIDEYERLRDEIWDQLIDYNCSLFLIERIETFPFGVLVPLPDNRAFWHLTKKALVERCIMIAWRITVDDHKDTLR